MSLKRKILTVEDLCEDARRFVDDIQKEPDRGVPIVACAFLDDVLGKLLEAHFIPDTKMTQKLFEYPGHLSYFAVRADMAYCLGLLPKKTYNDICLIKEIRNRFSHSHHPIDFQDEKVGRICEKLFFLNLTLDDKERKMFSAKSKFQTAVILVVNTILLKALSVKHAQVPKDYEMAERVKC